MCYQRGAIGAGERTRGTSPRPGDQKDVSEEVISYLSLERCRKDSQTRRAGQGRKSEAGDQPVHWPRSQGKRTMCEVVRI